ncbi:MAG: type II toxin-antitoxin system RelE/ParE family toxin [Patescibacteria group bacterium]
MKVFFSPEVSELLEKLSRADRSRLDRTREFFEEYGFSVGPKYVKKITKSGIWELRAGKLRLFLCIKGDSARGVSLIYKKSQKLNLKDLRLAEKRCKEL